MELRTTLLFFVLICSVVSNANESTLIGGDKVGRDEFKEVVWIRSGGSMCTASLVGPRVVLTAAHCVSRGSIEVVVDRGRVPAKCQIPDGYTRSVGDQDMALCKLDRDLPGPYASIADVGPKVGDEVTLIGYGCVQRGGGGGNDGTLRYGHAPVTRESDHGYHSFHTVGDSALCFGDSGGPAFERARSLKGHHVILGVNSRGNIQDTSLLTDLSHPDTKAFILAFEVSQDVSICGYKLDCKPKVEEDPKLCRRDKSILHRYERKIQERKEKLNKCLDKHR